MIILLSIGISISLIQFSEAYVLLQVRKQNDNYSNVDAIIHKVVPSDKFEKFSLKMARKQFLDRATDVRSESKQNEVKVGGKNDEVSLSVDENSDPNLMKLIDLAIKHFTKDGGPVLRASNEENKPKKIKFRTGESSVLYEINSHSFISGLQDLLSSKMFRNYLDKLTEKAAFVYRAIKT